MGAIGHRVNKGGANDGNVHANSFRGLIVYQKCRSLSRDVFKLTRGFPREEIYSLTDQVRRSSRSTGAQIAEAWAKRRYERYFVSNLSDADGEQMETQHWLESALDCDYITRAQAEELIARCQEIGRLLGGMMAKAHLFCQPDALREDQAPYVSEPHPPTPDL